MKLTQYFLIAPQAEVVERMTASSVSAEFASATKPVLWSSGENDKSALSHSDLEALVKLLFLDALHREHGADTRFANVFPGFACTEAFFDANWTSTRVALDMTVEDALEDSVASGSIRTWPPTGNERLDRVLGALGSTVSP